MGKWSQVPGLLRVLFKGVDCSAHLTLALIRFKMGTAMPSASGTQGRVAEEVREPFSSAGPEGALLPPSSHPEGHVSNK